jgi:hypothetical protein
LQWWGIDFIGEIIDKSSGGHSWILIMTNYFNKWVEAIPTKREMSKLVIDFLLEKILIKFGVPENIVSINSMRFRFEKFIDFCTNYGI